MDEIAFASAGELARRIRSKQLSSLELTDHFIERIERIDGDRQAAVRIEREDRIYFLGREISGRSVLQPG